MPVLNWSKGWVCESVPHNICTIPLFTIATHRFSLVLAFHTFQSAEMGCAEWRSPFAGCVRVSLTTYIIFFFLRKNVRVFLPGIILRCPHRDNYTPPPQKDDEGPPVGDPS